MALATIEVLAGRSRDDKRRLLQGVQRALCTALHVPADDPTIRIIEHSPDNMIIPPRHSNLYVIIVITMFRGRTQATKRCLYKTLVAELTQVDVPEEDVQIVVHEPSIENWSLGGIPASDTDPGFTIEI